MIDPKIEQLRQEADGMTSAFRSCWNCNPTHEDLKSVDFLIYCLDLDVMQIF